MRTLLIANWKMHYGPMKAGGWVRAFRRERLPKEIDIAVAVPHVSLAAARASLGRASIPALASQNSFWAKEGAYTGEVSPDMLQEFGVQYCLVGHSERRALLGETDEMVRGDALAEIEHREGGEHEQGDDFLYPLQLWCRINITAHAVGGYLQAVFKKRDAPTDHNDYPERTGFVFEMTVPGKGHEDIGAQQQ